MARLANHEHLFTRVRVTNACKVSPAGVTTAGTPVYHQLHMVTAPLLGRTRWRPSEKEEGSDRVTKSHRRSSNILRIATRLALTNEPILEQHGMLLLKGC